MKKLLVLLSILAVLGAALLASLWSGSDLDTSEARAESAEAVAGREPAADPAPGSALTRRHSKLSDLRRIIRQPAE